jgi:pimeloyl-ACP methyl ester carboxylesterase
VNVATPDGRTLRVYDAGDPSGVPVVVHHGTPSIGELYPPWSTDGVRLIGFDRAGYGGSTRHRGRQIADVAADVRAIADALELDTFATWGISGGGPHALACAALLPDRVFAAASLCSPAPFDADGLDWFAGQGEGNVAEHTAARQGETAVRPLLEQMHAAMAAGGAESLQDELASLLTGPDAAALTGELAAFLYESLIGIGGVDGWLDDDLAFVAPWGFDLGAIAVPVLVRHGEQDRFVPADHGRWLAGRIPGAEARITAADGHITLYRAAIPEVHAWLLQQDRSDDRRS